MVSKRELERKQREEAAVEEHRRRAFGDKKNTRRSGSHALFEEEEQAKDPAPLRFLGWLLKATFRYRWYILPLAVTGSLFGITAYDSEIAVAAMVALVFVAFMTATQLPDQIKGRTWLSRKERDILSLYAILGTVWTVLIAFGWLAIGWPAAIILAALTGYPIYKWMRSRRIRRDKVSRKNRVILENWKKKVAVKPGPLENSRVVAGSIEEPNEDTLAFNVRLEDVHGEDAATPQVRKSLEVILGVGIGTVQVQEDRDNSTQMRVIITPGRHLEKNNAEWLAPVIHENGKIDLAMTPDGKNIQIPVYNEHGVEHFAISGTTGTGKSNSVVTNVLPGIVQGKEVLWYADGGRGTSAPHLAKACDWRAVNDGDEWAAMIHAAVEVCKARHTRRAKLGLDEWRGLKETDPILTLVIDEASLVLAELKKISHEEMAWLLKNGRKVGVRVGQIVQDPMSDEWIGGRKARGLMSGGGTVIAHRPGDGTAAMLALTSTANKINLLELPPGEGWAAVVNKGTVLARKARVRYASKDAVAKALKGVVLRTLQGDDWIAAGSVYQGRKENLDKAGFNDKEFNASLSLEYAEVSSSSDQVERIVASASRAAKSVSAANRQGILDELADADGLTVKELMDKTGRSKTAVYNTLGKLREEEKVSQSVDGKWRLLA